MPSTSFTLRPITTPDDPILKLYKIDTQESLYEYSEILVYQDKKTSHFGLIDISKYDKFIKSIDIKVNDSHSPQTIVDGIVFIYTALVETAKRDIRNPVEIKVFTRTSLNKVIGLAIADWMQKHKTIPVKNYKAVGNWIHITVKTS